MSFRVKGWKGISNKGYGGKGILYKSEAQYPVNHLIIAHYNSLYGKWQVEDNKDMKTFREFETKAEALEYAKKLMEKKSEEYGKSKFEIMREERKMGYVK
jgi:hypothetical protein